jgi:ribonuclease D
MGVPEIILQPEKFRTAIAGWRHERQLWLDTEVADWFTSTPRVSLLQVRNASGRTWVVDVLDVQMRRVLDDEFIPEVMANDLVEKWAHYARFERRFLGQTRAANLNCTYELARSIPYYRLPLRSLSLAALVKQFFDVALDKTFQKADWGIRPLSSAQLEYAASDTEWCYRIHDRIRRIQSPPPFEDDPGAIRTRYLELLVLLKGAQTIRASIRDAVKEFMIQENVHRFARFALDARTTHSTDLGTLVDFALVKDPGGYFDLTVRLTSELRSQFGPVVEARLRSAAEIRISQSFRSPRAPRSCEASPRPYDLDPQDPARLTDHYETADHDVMVFESERGELRDRMKRWMRAQGLDQWEGFRFSSPREAWKVDLRAFRGVLPTEESIQVAFPQRLRLAFQDADLERLIAVGRSRETPVLRWLPRTLSVGLDAQQSRDWGGTVDPAAPEEEIL